MPKAAVVILAISAAVLTFVFIMQFGFGYDPCILCWWERLPYTTVILLSVIAFFWKPYGKQTQILLIFCAIVFFASACLAFFHTGVEQHWWLGTSGCRITPMHGVSVEDLRTQLLHTVMAHCDEISWTFLGLSMANWNVPASLIFALFSFAAARKSATRS